MLWDISTHVIQSTHAIHSSHAMKSRLHDILSNEDTQYDNNAPPS